MIRSLTTAATGMAVQQRNLDVIANNLANINTTAFKASRAEFQDLMYQTLRLAGAEQGSGNTLPAAQQVGMGAKFVANATTFATGPLNATGRQFDIALNGDGFFAVLLPDGTTAYTRDGSFSPDANGTLVTSDGMRLAANIQIPTNAPVITIAPNGTVSAQIAGGSDIQVLGQINVSMFPNPAGLERIGKNLFRVSGASGEATDVEPGTEGSGRLEQGFLEGSNVSMVDEMVRMIMAQRAYEVNSKAIQTADEMLSVTNNLRR
ncbi:MAG: Flagellar basal-body rod protein FlgG [Fimbriimonadales bacterium]|nr:MAG: flagellar basal-body rod protein FlgG [Armatimonadota bacterium]MBV6503050.1 Flagellar basal-body rod protein FlgG [Fimbriimonadales bacterium]MCE7899405.1 flagellar basal-body rod protein FlgG [Armatimonadetes bacterium ATM1]MDL1927979.1 flagellar basal-body rod protein FlgG [Fimbriimonadia bacterium ATM]MBC6969256.1 flagellar basal-body rod protein FlgG [Armatimonadota bacterium]